MAEIRPFRGLRYNPAKIPDLGAVMCPPYDVISPAEQQALGQRSPYNVIQVELAQENDQRAYDAAGAALAQWRRDNVLLQESRPAFYLARHEFLLEGHKRVRTEITAAVHLEEPGKGIVLPHEATRSKAKDDRLQLLRGTRTNVSPVMLLHDGLGIEAPPEPPLVADLGSGERFFFWAVTDPAKMRAFQEEIAAKRLYIADGHHRYETALNYRNEIRSAKTASDEASAFVMAALISFDDPGLIVQGYHRVFKGLDAPAKAALRKRIADTCDEQRLAVGAASAADIAKRVVDGFGRGVDLAVWGLEPCALLLLTAKGSAVDAVAARGHSRAWASLSNCFFREQLLQPVLGLQEEEAEGKGILAFSKEAGEAVQMVNAGEGQSAFLCKPVPFGAFKEVSERGERLPPKSTFFYPKLPTGLVMKAAEGKL